MVDDEPTTLDVLEMFLETAGYENVVSVTDSRRVMELLASRRPDVLVLNLSMPHVDGFDVLRAMRADPALASIPVIVLTSSDDPETKRRALELGAADFLAKPVDQSELVLRLRNTLVASMHRGGAARSQRRRARDARETPASSRQPLVSRLVGDEARVRRIVAEFTIRLEERLAAMDASLAAGDRVALADLAHWLKGAAGTVGFDAFTAPAEELRLLAIDGPCAAVPAKLRALRELAARIVVDSDSGGTPADSTHASVACCAPSEGEGR
jgi:DNA-binding response OmpR family regulator